MRQFTQKEFIKRVGISKPTVQNYTRELEKQGYEFEKDGKGHRRYTYEELELFSRIYNYLDEANGRISLEQVVRSLHPKEEEKYQPTGEEIIQLSMLEVACDLTDTDEYVPPTEPPYIPVVQQEQLLIDYEFIGEVQRAIKEQNGRISDVEEQNRRLKQTVERQDKARARHSLSVTKVARDLYNMKQEVKAAEEKIKELQIPWYKKIGRKKATN